MKTYSLKKVVVPYDFSNSSDEALSAAMEIVESPDNIRVVHVLPQLTTLITAEAMIIASEISEAEVANRLSTKFADSLIERGLPDLSFSTRFGDAGSQIARFAVDENAGLIVISSHGRTGLSRILLGSVAERVVRLAPCPVLVLRADTGEPTEA